MEKKLQYMNLFYVYSEFSISILLYNCTRFYLVGSTNNLLKLVCETNH